MKYSLADLKGKNIVVYDLEIAHLIDEVLPDGRKCGWDTPELLGFACAGLFDYETGDTTVYFEEDIPRLVERLNRADLVVGFNHIHFDNNLLRKQGHALRPEVELPSYDILVETRRGLGWTEGGRYPRGCNLNEHLRGMFGEKMMKTGDGADAPKLFQAKKFGPLVSYQIADVRRERMVFESVWLNGSTITPTNGRVLVTHPCRYLKAREARREDAAPPRRPADAGDNADEVRAGGSPVSSAKGGDPASTRLGGAGPLPG